MSVAQMQTTVHFPILLSPSSSTYWGEIVS